MDAIITFYVLKNNERMETIFRTNTPVDIQGEGEVFLKIYQKKYFLHVNENILFWKKSSQMTESCKFPRDISCCDIDDLVKKIEERFTRYFWWSYTTGSQSPIFEKNLLNLNLLV